MDLAGWVCVGGIVIFPVLALWSGWEGFLVGAFGCLIWVVGCCVFILFRTPGPVEWEENGRGHDEIGKLLLIIGSIGTFILLSFSLLSGDWSGMLTWLGLIAAVMLPWLLIVGLVALGWRILHRRSGPGAKEDRAGS
jgi:4-amino-4-deoxy-L-arabinose transferase-like glycosyltransferase